MNELMDRNVFYQQFWFSEAKPRRKSVPVLEQIEVQPALPGVGGTRYTIWYTWRGYVRQVTVEVWSPEEWQPIAADALTSDFWKAYPEDAARAFDFG